MIRFDEAIGAAVEVTRAALGEAEITVVRDAMGLVTVVVPGGEPAQLDAAARALHDRLGAYSPGVQQVLLTHADLLDPDDILRSQDRVYLHEERVHLVDRLLTNQDWLRRPVWEKPPLPLATGFSIKGGVGRTTALGVWAWHLARQGRNVVLIDLDLEAPGLAPLMLSQRPALGLVDWLAEDLVGQSESLSWDDLLGDASIADGTEGRVRVLAADGHRTRDYVAKLGRVLMPTVDDEGRFGSIADRLARLITRLHEEVGPDVVLLDARAGLHDLGAAAVTRLGAMTFCFARDEASSWEAWKHLFEHLQRASSVTYGGPDDDLRWRLKMVGAQVGPRERDHEAVRQRCASLWESLYDVDQGGRPFAFPDHDESAPHHALLIHFGDLLRGMNLADPAERIAWETIEAAFGSFLKGATDLLWPES